MEINKIILKVFGDVFKSERSRKLEKYVQLDRIKLEVIYSKDKTAEKTTLLVKTIKLGANETESKPKEMNAIEYEYSMNWWRCKNGHFNEELYKLILMERCPEIFR